MGIGIAICIIWTFVLFIALGVAATDFLCPALFVISQTLGLSQNVAGVTLIAFGNGSPDIFAAMAGLRQGRPELVIGGLFGGGTFITMVVIGSIFAVKSFRLLPMPFVRDLVFYLIATSWVFYLFLVPKKITLYDAIGFLLLYLFYVSLVVLSRYCEKGPKGGLVNPHDMGKEDPLHIEFEGIQPDEDPLAGMVVMKGFVFFGDEGALNYDKPPPYANGKPKKSSSMKRMSVTKMIEMTPIENNNNKNLPSIVPDIMVSPDKKPKQTKDNDSEVESTSNGQYLTVQSLAEFNNQFTITSLGKVSILEDTSMYETVNSACGAEFRRNMSRRGSTSSRRSRISVFTISKEKLIMARRQSQEFLEKISPIDFNGWKQQNWGGRSFEIIKAPIRFFLLLTTPMADIEGTHVWNKPLSVLHCISGPVFAIFATGFGATKIGPVPLPAIVFLVAAIISLSIVFTSKFETPPSYYKTYSSLVGFVVGVVWIYFLGFGFVTLPLGCISVYTIISLYVTLWIYFICNEVVSSIRSIGVAFNLSEPSIGLTMLSWGTSLLDFISNVSIARKGFPRMAVAACLGSPLLALLIGVGFQAIFITAQNGPIILEPDNMIFIAYFSLAGGLVMTLFITGVFKFVTKRWYGFLLLACYLIVMIIVALEEAGIFVPMLPRLNSL